MESKHLLLFLFFATSSLAQCSSYILATGRQKIDKADGGRKHYRILQDCEPLCIDRCDGNSNYKACLRTCGTCCSRCGCVPPGRYADRNSCGSCYADMTTHNGWLKCP